jgi:coproporphyrinogen III oxidase
MVKKNNAKKMMLHHASNILDQFAPNVPTAMFPGLPTLENIEGKNVSWFAQGFSLPPFFVFEFGNSARCSSIRLP